MPSREDVTQMLLDLSAGKEGAGDALLPVVYEELRALAHRYMKKERSGHTLQATALVHEAFMRLVGEQDAPWDSRAHYFRVAARAMRRILIDHARRKKTDRKGGDWERSPIEEAAVFIEETSADPLELDEALDRLAEKDPQAVQVVELRFFAGLTVEDTAKVLSISPKTVKRDWRMARAWLKRDLAG